MTKKEILEACYICARKECNDNCPCFNNGCTTQISCMENLLKEVYLAFSAYKDEPSITCKDCKYLEHEDLGIYRCSKEMIYGQLDPDDSCEIAVRKPKKDSSKKEKWFKVTDKLPDYTRNCLIILDNNLNERYGATYYKDEGFGHYDWDTNERHYYTNVTHWALQNYEDMA